MIRFSAEEYVPYPVDELIIQNAILRREPGGESKVLAVLAHRDVLKNHLAPLRKAGIIPQRVLLSTACLANAVTAARPPAQGAYALANLSSSGLEILVFLGSKLLFGRGVASEQDWSKRGADAAGADEELAIEVRGSLSAYRRESEDGEGAENVYLASDYPIAIEERAAMSPDSLTGLEANLRFSQRESMETRIFGRLSAWQNWIFNRPNAVGEKGAVEQGDVDRAKQFLDARALRVPLFPCVDVGPTAAVGEQVGRGGRHRVHQRMVAT